MGLADRRWQRLETLDDDELRDARFDLYDDAEAAGSDPVAWAKVEARVQAIDAVERRRAAIELLKEIAQVWLPDCDADAFADAAAALVRAQHELSGRSDIAAWLEGAIEVGRAAKQRTEEEA